VICVAYRKAGLRLWRCLAIVVTASAGLLLAACSSSGSPPAPIDNRASPVPTPITIRITLAHTRAVAGTPIKGKAVLTNTTSKTITVESCAADGWFEVGLVNSQIGFDPANRLIVCPPSIRLSPGPNRFPLSVVTTYQACTQSGGGSPNFPPCGANGLIPALPPGGYTTKIVTYGLPAGTPTLRPMSVTLLSTRTG
jgi:hypothetical protein